MTSLETKHNLTPKQQHIKTLGKELVEKYDVKSIEKAEENSTY